MSKQRIGLLGGTFDPPHGGHMWLAEAAQAQLGLARVLFLPVGEPVHKEGEITAG
ncbi:MAG: nicotinate-nucleotide adenylyltransferase, partial [Chloroflexota bacterium]